MLNSQIDFARLLPLLFLAAVAPLSAQTPEWIWHNNQGAPPADDETRWFRKTFNVVERPARAVLTVACDNEAAVFLNGKPILENKEWNEPSVATFSKEIKADENVIAVRAQNHGGPAGLLVKLELLLADDRKQTFVSDASWLSSAKESDGWTAAGFSGGGWTKAASLAKLGGGPWGDVKATAAAAKPSAPPAEKLTVPPGFKIELLLSAEPDEGSWVAMTVDDKGRLILSPQYPKKAESAGLLRVTLDGSGRVAKKEWIATPMYEAQGLLYANRSLYVVVNHYNGPFKSGLYRLQDTDGDDQFDQRTLLKEFGGGGEHGPHGVALGPDNLLYVMIGNHTRVPEGASPESPHRNYAEDFLLPRQWDAGGHAVGVLAPGGTVVRTDLEGKKWEVVLGGFRNAYDLDFNADGELFTFDSDMEWEWGMHWYRPTRVYHCTSAAEFGWRSGSGKWPAYFPDGLPPAADIGLGSPTGVKFGTGAKFPPRYQRAFYAMDWSYGRIVAVHLTPQGSSYEGAVETFVQGKPLNVTDLEIGQDGAMYFTAGGRGTHAGLYRVSYTGSESTGRADRADDAGAQARTLRRRLESFHGKSNPAALDAAWPHLDSPDRWIRYAARIAIESQPVEQWRQRALDETRKNASLTALLALARLGPKSAQNDLLDSLGRYWPGQLNEEQKLEVLRVCSLAFIRMGKPDSDTAQDVVRSLDPAYPSTSEHLNRELCQLLIYLEAPGVIAKSLALHDAARTQEEQIHYLFQLRSLKSGWTPELRQRYFTALNAVRPSPDRHPPELIRWFQEAGRPYSDGASYAKQLAKIRAEAVAGLSDAERGDLAALITVQPAAPELKARPRSFVKEWKMEELSGSLAQAGNGRSYERGRQALADAQCLACHKFGNDGGASGPELTAAASKYSRRDILEAIIEPSKVVSEQYQNTTITLKNGDDVTGRIVDDNERTVALITDPIKQTRVEVKKAEVQSRVPSRLSPMPDGLVNILTKEDILDLLAYIESGGKKEHAAFKSGN